MKDPNEAIDLIKEMNSEEIQKEVIEAKKYPHIIQMQIDLLNFVIDRLSLIRSEENFRDRIKSAILQKIDDDSVSVPQLISLLKNTNTDSMLAADSVFSLMRPSKDGVVSPLVDPKQNTEREEDGEFNSNLTIDQSETLHKLMRILQKLDENTVEKNISGVDSSK